MKNSSKLIIIFILLLNSGNAQTFDWAKRMEGSPTSTSEGNSVVVDMNGNVFTTGYFSNTVDFNPAPFGSHLLASSGGEDFYIQKLDINGDLVWVKRFGSSSDNSRGTSIDIDASGNIYITGIFNEIIDFDPGVGIFNLTPVNFDIFILKLDNNGNFLWVKQVGGSSLDYVSAIKVDDNGNVYTGGSFRNTADFNPGAGVANLTSNGNSDGFILKLDSNGNYIWAKHFGGSNIETVHGLDVNSTGDVYAVGWFRGVGDFDPGAGVYSLIPIDNYDAFVLKLSSNGNFNWAKAFGGVGKQKPADVAVNSTGDLLITGSYESTVDFNPGGGAFFLTASATRSMFVQKLNSNGDFIWAKSSVGGTTIVEGNSVNVDVLDNIYITGTFANTVDFNPGTATANLTCQFVSDGYVLNLNPIGNFISVNQLDGGNNGIGQPNDLDISSSGDIHITGHFSGTVDFDPSVNNHDLTTGSTFCIFVEKMNSCISYTELNDTICSGNTYYFNNQNLYTGGVYYDTLANVNGCDSLVKLNLTVTIYNIFLQDSICVGESYILGTQTITQAGTYTELFQTVQGCDSIVDLQLYVEALPTVTISQNGSILQASASLYYQWYLNGNILTGETNQTYTPSQNGTYSVEVSSANNCTGTDSFIIEGLSINSYSNLNISASPNPSTGVFTLKSDINFTYKVYNVIGEQIMSSNSQTTSSTIDLSTYEVGIYFVKIKVNNTNIKTIKLVKIK